MGLIRMLLLVLLCASFGAKSQSDDLLIGNGRHAVFYELDPEFMSVMYTQAITKSNNKWHIGAGFKFNIGEWLGVPLEMSYLIPVGNKNNHLSLGVTTSYNWDANKKPYEFWLGPKMGLRHQPDKAGLFVRGIIAYTYVYYVDGDASTQQWRIRPSVGVGFTF